MIFFLLWIKLWKGKWKTVIKDCSYAKSADRGLSFRGQLECPSFQLEKSQGAPVLSHMWRQGQGRGLGHQLTPQQTDFSDEFCRQSLELPWAFVPSLWAQTQVICGDSEAACSRCYCTISPWDTQFTACWWAFPSCTLIKSLTEIWAALSSSKLGQASLERRQMSPLRLPTTCLGCQTDFVFNKYLIQEENLKAHGKGSNYPVAQVRRRQKVWQKVSTCDTTFLKGKVGSVWDGRIES